LVLGSVFVDFLPFGGEVCLGGAWALGFGGAGFLAALGCPFLATGIVCLRLL